MPHRDEVYSVRLFEDGAGVVANGNGDTLTVRNLSDKTFQIQGGAGNTFSIAMQFSIDEGSTWHEFLAATAANTDTAPTLLPAAAGVATSVRCVVSGFSVEGTRPVVTLVGRRST